MKAGAGDLGTAAGGQHRLERFRARIEIDAGCGVGESTRLGVFDGSECRHVLAMEG